MSIKDFEIGKELGKGAFGSVCLVTRKEDRKTYAMKRVKMGQLSYKEKENALNEIRILASLQHENIIAYHEAFFDDMTMTLNFVMEFADDGDIEGKIKQVQKGRLAFDESTIWLWLIQMIQGLKYLHENKIMHRDLKSANIFLMKNGILKIGDLNVSKITRMGMAQTQTGTPYYASPEIWKDKPYDYKCDIWSVGVIIYELCTLRPPFRGTSLKNLADNIMRGVYEPIPSRYSSDLSRIIKMMLCVDAHRRPSADQLLNLDIIQKKINSNKNEVVAKIMEHGQSEHANLMKTIKVPRNLKDINKQLPGKRYKKKKKEEEMMENDEFETAKAEVFKQAALNNNNNNHQYGGGINNYNPNYKPMIHEQDKPVQNPVIPNPYKYNYLNNYDNNMNKINNNNNNAINNHYNNNRNSPKPAAPNPAQENPSNNYMEYMKKKERENEIARNKLLEHNNIINNNNHNYLNDYNRNVNNYNNDLNKENPNKYNYLNNYDNNMKKMENNNKENPNKYNYLNNYDNNMKKIENNNNENPNNNYHYNNNMRPENNNNNNVNINKKPSIKNEKKEKEKDNEFLKIKNAILGDRPVPVPNRKNINNNNHRHDNNNLNNNINNNNNKYPRPSNNNNNKPYNYNNNNYPPKSNNVNNRPEKGDRYRNLYNDDTKSGLGMIIPPNNNHNINNNNNRAGLRPESAKNPGMNRPQSGKYNNNNNNPSNRYNAPSRPDNHYKPPNYQNPYNRPSNHGYQNPYLQKRNPNRKVVYEKMDYKAYLAKKNEPSKNYHYNNNNRPMGQPKLNVPNKQNLHQAFGFPNEPRGPRIVIHKK